METSTLRPGLLVSLKTAVVGNAKYNRRDVEPAHLTDDGEERAAWETQRTIADKAEYEAGQKVRAKCRSMISTICTPSTFGLLCPDSSSDQLTAAVEEAQGIAQAFNDSAKLTRVGVYVIAGRVAADDVQAVKAINSEVRSLLNDMERGLEALDVNIVREAANKAKRLGAMLSPDAAARIQIAIDAARTSARKIVKAAEQGAAEIDRQAIRAITESRTAFLDLDDQREVKAPSDEGRAIDLALPETNGSPERTKPEASQVELDDAKAVATPRAAAAPAIDL